MLLVVKVTISLTDVADSRPTRGKITPPTRPLVTPHGLSTNTGPLASAAWLVDLGLYPKDPKWSVEIMLAAGGTCLRVEIFAEEWGFVFEHEGRVSWIRVTDLRFVHGQDDFGLVTKTPPLKSFGSLVRELEATHAVQFPRGTATIRSEIPDSDAAIRAWVERL